MSPPLDQDEIAFVLRHFRNPKPFPWNEKTFIDILQTSKRKSDLYHAAFALRDCGTAACVPVLKWVIETYGGDVRCVAIHSVGHVAKASESLFYSECLLNPKYPEKDQIMWVIHDAADARALPVTIEYLKKIRSRIRARKIDAWFAALALEYLRRQHDADGEIAEHMKDLAACVVAAPVHEMEDHYRNYLKLPMPAKG